MIITGDLTDRKDYHPAVLTNRIVKEVLTLRAAVDEVIILMGNHDYLLEGHSYFSFLSSYAGVHFVTKPTEFMLDGGPSAYFLPHTKTPAKTWAGMDFSHYDLLFMHQTVTGSVASNGQVMDGEEMPPLNAGRVFSGDIHVPQKIGPVEYIGSPYHVHFGDRFKPRCLLIDRKLRQHDLHFETISRIAITAQGVDDLRRLKLRPGDQVKVKVKLAEAEAPEWSARRRAIADYLRRQEVELHGIELEVEKSARVLRRLLPGQASRKVSAPDAVLGFVERNALGADAADAGLEILG